MCKIKSDVPIPNIKRGRKAKYPLRQLDVGDSFSVSLDGKKLTHIRGAIFGYAGKLGIKITSQVQENTLTIWRVK